MPPRAARRVLAEEFGAEDLAARVAGTAVVTGVVLRTGAERVLARLRR